MKTRLLAPVALLGLALGSNTDLPATLTWSNATDRDWNGPANWSPQHASSNTDIQPETLKAEK